MGKKYSSYIFPSLSPHPAPPSLLPAVQKLPSPETHQLPPTLSWPPRLGQVQHTIHKSVSAFESYANLLKQADTKVERKEDDLVDVTDIISVSRSPSPLNISSASETSSKSSHSFPEENRNNILEQNKNQPGPVSPLEVPKFPPNPLFPFGSPAHLPALSSLYNPLPFTSPLYRLR